MPTKLLSAPVPAAPTQAIPQAWSLCLTVEDVAGRLQVHHTTVREWIDRGRLKASRFGRAIRIRETELAAFLDRSTR